MAVSYKTLGQSNPAATTETDLYTVPAGTQAVVSSIVVANTNAAARTYRITIAVAAAATVTKQYIAYDVSINGNSVATYVLGISLQPTDKIRIYASANDLAFNAFGVEMPT